MGDLHDEPTSRIGFETRFNHIYVSFFLNDLAVFYTNYLTNLTTIESEKVTLKGLKDLIRGYQAALGRSLQLESIELFKFLLLFNLQSKFVDKKPGGDTEDKTANTNRENLYELLYDYDSNEFF